MGQIDRTAAAHLHMPLALPPDDDLRATHPDETPGASRPLVSVLSVSVAGCVLNDPAAALPTRNHQYLMTSLVDPSADTVERHLGTDPPRLVLMDLQWCESAGPDLLQRLCQLAPSPDWVVCWPRPARQWMPHLLACGARGAVTCDAAPQTRAKALDGVLNGEIWLPRLVLQWLYGQMLEQALVTARELQSAAMLTPREAEVMRLIHRGLTNREVSARLGVTVNTVKKHLAKGFDKLGLHRRRQLLG